MNVRWVYKFIECQGNEPFFNAFEQNHGKEKLSNQNCDETKFIKMKEIRNFQIKKGNDKIK